MQSRLAATVGKFNQIVRSGSRKQFLSRSLGSATVDRRSAGPEEVSAINDAKQRLHSPDQKTTGKDAKPYVLTKSGPKLETLGVGPLTNPIAQQKRRDSNYSTSKLDPWPESESKIDRKTQKEEQERDNIEYFKHHKASPLSEIKVAETRKPITQATDDDNNAVYVTTLDGSRVKLYTPEQKDTEDDSLRRAREVWRMSAERGDPESPHGRVLRQLRGEDW